MNIAFFLLPKSKVGYLYDDQSIRQGLEKMRHYGYAAIPVITHDGCYVGTISEGDFLWRLLRKDGSPQVDIDIRATESQSIRDLIKPEKNPPVYVTATIEELLTRSLDQNFIPVIDDTGVFIGIVTRRDIMKFFYEKMI